MSEFMKIVSSLKQNFFACLPAIAGREASPALEKPGGLPSRRVGGDSLVVWLPGDTKQGVQLFPQGGGVGHRNGHFRQ